MSAEQVFAYGGRGGAGPRGVKDSVGMAPHDLREASAIPQTFCRERKEGWVLGEGS